MNATRKIAFGTLAAAGIFCGGLGGGWYWAKYTSEPPTGSNRIRAPGTLAGTRSASPVTPKLARYRATTRFQINKSSARDFFSSGFLPGTRDQFRANWFEVQVKAISSRRTLLMAVKNLNLWTEWRRSPYDAATRLAGMIKIEQERNAAIVSLSAWSDKAEEATVIANGVRDAYEQQRKENAAERILRLRENVATQVRLQELAVENARLEMLELMKKHNIVDLERLNSAVIQQPSEIPGAANLLDSAEIKESSEAPLETDPAGVATERQKQSEYATEKHRYESQIQVLHSIREHLASPAEEAASVNPIEILEPAVAVEDR